MPPPTATPPAPDDAPRFIADAMLGRLARWLRVLGFDTRFDPALDDPDLARLAAAQRRFLLTRDRRLCAERADPRWCVLVHAQRPAGQVRELDRRFHLFRPGWPDRLFARCPVCNTPLLPIDADAILDADENPAAPAAVPRRVLADPAVRSAGFRRCPGCGRVYWEGGHTRRMREWLRRVAGEE